MMAKKRAEKVTTKGPNGQPTTPSFDEMFPTITRWISHEEGWVELGADDYSHSLVRALYGGGMVWEGKGDYKSLDEALRAMDEGIAAWLEDNRPDEGQSRRTKAKPSPRPGLSAAGRKSPKATHPKRDDRIKGEATPAVPRAFVEKARKFAEIAEALRKG